MKFPDSSAGRQDPGRLHCAHPDLAPSPEFVRAQRVLPFARPDGSPGLAVDPRQSDACATDGFAALLAPEGGELELEAVDGGRLGLAIEHRFGGSPAPVSGFPAESQADSQSGPVVSLVAELIAAGLERGASDIHFEAQVARLRVRHRVDGILHDAGAVPSALHPAVISRLKILAGMSIAERRAPQDGRLRFESGDRIFDLRAASSPSLHGESLVLRVLDSGDRVATLESIGLAAADLATLSRLVELKQGLLLVTGPTGSGKTTTLFGCLQRLNGPGRKIITVEDPVECRLRGLNQVPVRTDVGLTFAAALRAILRQAPNVVMIGEIRDAETAAIACQAALTGHLVFSTMHTDDAVGAVTRLIDLGVRRPLLTAALRGVLAQRLVRRCCTACGKPAAAKCPRCGGTGFRGRTGIFEMLPVDGALQERIQAGDGASKLREWVRAAGVRSLRDDGLRKVTAGLTTAEEVFSITVEDGFASNPT